MVRIMIFNGQPEASQKRLAAEGGQSNEAMFTDGIGRHAPFGTPVEYFTLNVADGEHLPQGMALSDFDGVAITGSPLNVYHDIPQVRVQIDLARDIWNAGIPTFGSCWGLQLMCAAVGGSVHLNPRGREIGIARNIGLNETGRMHPLYREKGPAFDALCSHEDEVVALPACGRVLASNAVSRVQAADLSDGKKSFWGVQYHPEFTFAQVASIIVTRVERHIREGLARTPDEVQRVVEDYRVLNVDPTRTDLAWRYGVGADILDPGMRTREFRNWLFAKVLPYAAGRG